MTDEELRDLKERSATIRELSEHPGWELLKDRARARMFMDQTFLIRGRADDFTAYVKLCAWLDGVSYVLELPDIVEQELQLALTDLAERKVADSE